jgi:CheY-specific phosphatase CheX
MNPHPEINAAAVNEWLQKAVQDVTETMFNLGAFPVEAPDNVPDQGDMLVACIGVRGKFQLETAIFFTHSLAQRLASISLETPVAELDEKMVGDVAGEFSNMVVGAVKSRISDLQVECTMTVPRVVLGIGGSADLTHKVQAALAVIRGSAGPRNTSTSVHSKLHYSIGEERLRLEIHA